jgi:hypothetical protein
MEPGIIVAIVLSIIVYEILVFYLTRDVLPHDVLYSSDTNILMKMICVSIVLPAAVIAYLTVVICLSSITLVTGSLALVIRFNIIILYAVLSCFLPEDVRTRLGDYAFKPVDLEQANQNIVNVAILRH